MIKNVLLKVRIAAQNRKLVFNLSLVSKPQSHLALGLSPTIHFLIRLLPPLVLFSQISSLTFPSSLACTCKLSISHHAKHPLTHTHRETNTHCPQELPETPQSSHLSTRNRAGNCVEELLFCDNKNCENGRKKSSVRDYPASRDSRLSCAVLFFK